MQRVLVRGLCLLTMSVFLLHCEENDLGTACPPREDTEAPTGSTGDDNEQVFQATVRKDSGCESFACVSTATRENYCSQDCRSDRTCPDGFVCQELQPVGPNAGVKYCVLQKPCRPGNTNDCPKDRFVCKEVKTSIPDQPAYYCDVK